MKALVIVAVLAGAAHADPFAGATPVSHVDDIVWAVTAACDKGDDTQQRQCRQIRDRKANQIVGVPLLVDGDATAFDAGKWNAAKKSLPLNLIGCVRCDGTPLDGKPWVLASAPRAEGGKVRGSVLYDNAKQFPDEAAAVAWAKTVADRRVQFVIKVTPKSRTQVGGPSAGRQAIDGLAVDIVAWRVYTPCDGAIVIASAPDVGALPADKKSCAKP